MTRLSSEFYQANTGGAAPPCTVNYVWINIEPFMAGPEDHHPQCGVPLHYVDRAIENAKRYPDAQFQIWIDERYLLDSPTVIFLQSHLHASDCGNIRIRDLNEIDAYREDDFFAPEEEKSMWHRADLARFW